MKFKVYDGPKNKLEVLYLKLEEEDDGVCLKAVDASGKPYGSGKIVKITKDGRLYLCTGVADNLGLVTDSKSLNRIKMANPY